VETGAMAGVAGLLAVSMGLIEIVKTTVNKRHPNGNGKITLLESKLEDLAESQKETDVKVRETLKIVYELREEYRIDKARREAKGE